MNTWSPLRIAFANARKSGNIEDIFPEFIKAKLLVVCKRVPTSDRPVFFAQRSPNPSRWCITAAESANELANVHDVELVEFTGRSLLAGISDSQEIVIVYQDGGDYLTLEQLRYFRSLPNSLPI